MAVQGCQPCLHLILVICSEWIERHNGGNHSYTLGHNRFSHLTFDEFKGQVGGITCRSRSLS